MLLRCKKTPRSSERPHLWDEQHGVPAQRPHPSFHHLCDMAGQLPRCGPSLSKSRLPNRVREEKSFQREPWPWGRWDDGWVGVGGPWAWRVGVHGGPGWSLVPGSPLPIFASVAAASCSAPVTTRTDTSLQSRASPTPLAAVAAALGERHDRWHQCEQGTSAERPLPLASGLQAPCPAMQEVPSWCHLTRPSPSPGEAVVCLIFHPWDVPLCREQFGVLQIHPRLKFPGVRNNFKIPWVTFPKLNGLALRH